MFQLAEFYSLSLSLSFSATREEKKKKEKGRQVRRRSAALRSAESLAYLPQLEATCYAEILCVRRYFSPFLSVTMVIDPLQLLFASVCLRVYLWTKFSFVFSFLEREREGVRCRAQVKKGRLVPGRHSSGFL